MTSVDGTIRVLHVDEDGDLASFLASEYERLHVETVPDPERAFERLAGADVDCVVSDVDVPGTNGLQLLSAVREEYPDLPFVLFTADGSEAMASEAIAAGVTDYVPRVGDGEPFAVLAERVQRAVEAYRHEQEVARRDRRFRKLIEESVDVVAIFEPDGTFKYLSPAAESVAGYPPGDLLGENVFEYIHPQDRDRVVRTFASVLEDPSRRVSVVCRFRATDGEWVDLDVRGKNRTADPDVGGILVHGQLASERVQREKELVRYETMVNESGDMIYSTDAGGRITAVNDAAVAFVGYPREDLVGEDVSKIVTETSAEAGRRAARALADADDAGGVTIEQEFVTAAGETIPSEAHLTPLRDSNGSLSGTVGVVRDISLHKERERTFRALHGATHELVAAESREEVVDVLVETARDVLGLSLVGLWLYDEEERALLPAVYPDDPALPDDPPVYREGDGLSWNVFVDGESRTYSDLGEERDRYNPDTAIGSELIVPVGDYGVLNSGAIEPGTFDETDRYLADILAKTAAAALDRVEREAVLARLHASTRELMAAGDRREIAERALSTARDVLGYDHVVVRFLDETEQELRPVATTEQLRSDLGERPTYRVGEGTAGSAFERGEATVFDARTIDDDVTRGSKATILCVPIGEHGVLTIAHSEPGAFDDADVQLAKLLASNVQTALDRVDRERELSQQNERLEEFASAVSHDLRNPLNVALVHLELLREERDGERLGRIDEALRRMATLVEDVLSLARGGRDVVDPVPVSLSSVAQRAWSTAGSADGTLSVDDGVGEIEGDEGRLQQLLENLFRNAREHAGDDVAVRLGPLDGGFSVEDDGPGVPADHRERVFESGYTTSAAGTGFGLAIVERIAEAHGWTVEVTEGRTGGARFEVTGVSTGSDRAGRAE